MPIIVSRDGRNAQKVLESGVADEDYLQRFVADNPDSLPIEDIKENVRLMVIGREFDTPSGPIDILAVDDDGDIYIIETKLYKNADKRLVLAQVLDYGAALWRGYTDPTKFISDVDTFMIRRTGNGLPHALGDFYGLADEEIEEAIDSIKSQLQAGSFRFVVLMDRLHARLKDLILFMNERSTFDIYAVEMEFYQHEGLEIVIPKVFGAQVTKSLEGAVRKTRRWDEESFFGEIFKHEGEDTGRIAKELYDWVKPRVSEIQWGTGQKFGSYTPVVNTDSGKIRIFYVWTSGRFAVWPQILIEKTCFRDEGLLAELHSRLNGIPSMNVSPVEIRRYISERPLSLLSDPTSMEAFKSAFDWMIKKINDQND